MKRVWYDIYVFPFGRLYVTGIKWWLYDNQILTLYSILSIPLLSLDSMALSLRSKEHCLVFLFLFIFIPHGMNATGNVGVFAAIFVCEHVYWYLFVRIHLLFILVGVESDARSTVSQ